MNITEFPSKKPEIIDTLKGNAEEALHTINTIMSAKDVSFQYWVDQLFWFCVEILKLGGEITGLGYNLLNIIVFIILQPALIVLFFILWISARQKNNFEKPRLQRDESNGNVI